MKKIILTWFIITGTAIFFSGCNTGNSISPERQLVSDKEISVSWNDTSDTINAFEAKVSVYSMNSRRDTSLNLTSQYHLTAKLINDEQYVRLDMLNQSPDGRFRSVISNDKEMIMFDSASNEIQQRIPLEAAPDDLAFMGYGLGFGKVNLDSIKKEATRLNFDITEDKKNSSLTLSLPNELFTSEFEKRISTRVSFDSAADVLTEMETVAVKNDGATVTTSAEYVYQKCGDEYVKVGMITKIVTDYEKRIEGIPEDTEYFKTIDDIPEISEEDFNKMKENGNIFEEPSVKFGDPGDLSCIETIVEVYEDVEVNKTEDSVFKLLGNF